MSTVPALAIAISGGEIIDVRRIESKLGLSAPTDWGLSH